MKRIKLKGNSIKILLHLLAWSILLGLPLYVVNRWTVGKDFIWLYYINSLISGIIFYANYLVLIPRYFFNRKRYKYYLSVVLLIACFYFISDVSNKLVFNYLSLDEQVLEIRRQQEREPGPGLPHGEPFMRMRRPPFREMHLSNYGFNALFLIFLSIGLRVLERHAKIEELQKELETEKLNSELAFLKNQISPHFFFNTLNNIYALIGINTADSQNAVLKLSKLMRYLLYESEQGNTKLSSEIDFMNNYIDLMKLRMSDKVALEVSFPGKYDDINIPPLLFVPFIENAFKHGISYREKSYIRISMLTVSNSITFKCTNSYRKSKDENSDGHSGIGLENVSKRLSLLFPGKHELKIKKSDTEFEVFLFISIV